MKVDNFGRIIISKVVQSSALSYFLKPDAKATFLKCNGAHGNDAGRRETMVCNSNEERRDAEVRRR